MESEMLVTILTTLYGVSGILSMIAYVPTIKDLWRGLPSANIYTYGLRLGYYSIAVVYGVVVLKDFIFVAVTSVDITIIFVIIGLILRQQYLQRKKEKKSEVKRRIVIFNKVTFSTRKIPFPIERN